MLILTIVSRKKYFKYVLYQMIIFFLTILSSLFILRKDVYWNVLYIVEISIACVTLILSVIFCKKDFMLEIKKQFHI